LVRVNLIRKLLMRGRQTSYIDAVEKESGNVQRNPVDTHDARNKYQHHRVERTNDARQKVNGPRTIKYGKDWVDRKIVR
jgi:hypothetical protein